MIFIRNIRFNGRYPRQYWILSFTDHLFHHELTPGFERRGYFSMTGNEPSAACTPPADKPPACGDTQQHQQPPAAGQQKQQQGPPNAARGVAILACPATEADLRNSAGGRSRRNPRMLALEIRKRAHKARIKITAWARRSFKFSSHHHLSKPAAPFDYNRRIGAPYDPESPPAEL